MTPSTLALTPHGRVTGVAVPDMTRRFARCEYGDVVMSSITLAELRFGALVSPQQAKDDRALAGLLEDVPALPFEDRAAAAYAAVRAAGRERRRDALDRLIAGHAIAADCVLVTNNEADFRGYPGLQLENWRIGFSNALFPSTRHPEHGKTRAEHGTRRA